MTQLKLDPRNARRHSDRNKRQIKQSLETVGAGRSILADADGIVRAGNGVFAEWGDKPIKIVETDGKELVVVQRTDLRGQAAIRAAALDNLVADSSAFDYDAAILAEIARDDDVIRAIANEDAKLRELLRKENGTAEKVDAGELIDKAAQLQEKWKVCKGDVWQVGKHRLMCGDSTSKEDVERLMDGKRAQLGFHDPPYNLGINYTEATDDKRETVDYLAWIILWFALAKECCAVNLITPGYQNIGLWYGFEKPNGIAVWTKRNSMKTGSPIAHLNAFEPILFYGKPKKKRGQDVVDIPIVPDKELTGTHPVPKQIKFILDVVESWSDSNDAILDLFLGSGTSLVACEQTGRIGYGMELEPKYCSVALERLANLGLQPQRIQIAG